MPANTALNKRIAQAREQVARGSVDEAWALQLLGYLADEAEAFANQAALRQVANEAEEQSAELTGRGVAYVQGVADTLAWLAGEVSGNVFLGGPLSDTNAGRAMSEAAGA